MPEIKPVEVTEENAAEIAEVEFKKEKAEREGKEPEEKEDKDIKDKQDDGGEKKEGAEGLSDDELLKADDTKLNDEQKAKKKELLDIQKEEEDEKQKKTDDELVNANDEELDDEKKTKKQEIIKKRETLKKEEEDKDVKTYAAENDLSEDEARSELQSIAKIREQFKDDQKQLAKANLHLRRLQTRTAEELKAVSETMKSERLQKITADEVISELIDKGQLKVNGRSLTRDDIVRDYKNANPDLPEDLSDEAVLKLAARDIRSKIIETESKKGEALEGDAKKRRSELVNQLSEEDKKWLPAFKEQLDQYGHAEILNPAFSLKDLVYWAKGKVYDKDVKERETAAFKRGQESIKVKSPVGGDDRRGPAKKDGISLTDAQKNEALEMFPSAKDDNEAYKLYAEAEAYKKSLRDKKNKK